MQTEMDVLVRYIDKHYSQFKKAYIHNQPFIKLGIT